ncbi:MAG: hypothetical protein KBT11_11075 [Treponema sp.]|nr:hypothetical protein [Candidatus Treponema equifaecale]
MKVKPSILISIAVSIISLFLLLGFRTIPVSRLWKGYQVLYVFTNELTQQDILQTLQKNGCSEVVSKSNQQMPVVSPVSPVQVQNQDSYIFKRNSFFTDRTGKAMVFYVPDSSSQGLSRAISEISAFQGTMAGTDGKSSFPWIAPILSLIFTLVLLYFSENKSLFGFCAIFPIIFAFCRPMYTVAASAIFLNFALFLFHRIWKRKDFVKSFFNSPYSTVFTASPFLLLIFSSPANAAFYLVSVLGILANLNLFNEWEEAKYKSYSFKPVYIVSSRMIPLVGRLGIRLMGGLVATIVILTLISNFFGKITDVTSNATSPSLPAPVSSSNSELTNISDLMDWSWNTITFPYRKINSANTEKPKEGDSVAITDYIETNGTISQYSSQMYVYNGKFKDSILDKIENLNYPALEKMMLKQGKNASYGFSKGKLTSSERFGFIILSCFIFISCGLSGYYILGRK